MITEPRPDAYLIVRPADGMSWTQGSPHGFALVAVRRSGDQLQTMNGETINVADDARFLFPQDADRAVARGIAHTRDGVLVGTRFPALAVFPHLRIRHLPVASVLPPNPPVRPSSPGATGPAKGRSAASTKSKLEADVDLSEIESQVTEPTVLEAPSVESSAIGEESARPTAPLAPLAEEVESDAASPLDDPFVAGPATSEERGKGDSESAAVGMDVDALARATSALEQGLVPSEDDLEELSGAPISLGLILDRSVDLGPEKQMVLADLAIFFLAADDDPSLMHKWLTTVEARLIGHSDLLVQLLRTWLDADGRSALGEIRKLIRVNAISLKQRRPAEVALLLRDAARVVGDGDSLREAYESMADAPKRTKDPQALRLLLQELEEEDGPTQAELRAIGLPILLQAFKTATDEDLGELATDAERYLRGYLRADPPNVESARLVEPVLVAAHGRVPESQRPSIENVLRELRQLGAIAPAPSPASGSSVAVTYEELLRNCDGRSPNLEIVAAAYDSARAWGKDGTEYLGALRDALEATIRVADKFAAREFTADGAVGAFAAEGQVLVPFESDTATRHSRTRKAHTVRNRQGQPVELGPHLKFGQGYRLYLALDKQRRLVYVGRIGDHLPGKKSKDRPR